jgi:DNA modification methylase
MKSLIKNDIAAPGATSIQAMKKKRGRPQKSPAESDELVSPVNVLEPKAPKTVDPRNALNELTSTEWLPETVSVWNQRGLGAKHPDAQIEKQHPAPFSFTDVSRIVRFFSKRNDFVLDPFVGVGSTLKACAVEGRNGIGFELNPRYAELAEERLRIEVRDMFSALVTQEVRVGDARELVAELPDNSLDLIVTSPPYWNILHKVDHKAKQERESRDLDTKYSDDKRDLGNIDEYEIFLEELASILGGCGRALKRKKYMAVIVSDFRDKSRFVMFHSDIAKSLEKYKLELRGLTILYQRHKRVFPYGYPYAYVPNIHHQYIMILQNMKNV